MCFCLFTCTQFDNYSKGQTFKKVMSRMKSNIEKFKRIRARHKVNLISLINRTTLFFVLVEVQSVSPISGLLL